VGAYEDLRLHGKTAVQAMQSNHEYIRARIAPLPGDPFYLHLRDLLDAIRGYSSSEPLCILDYGAGLSPYRSLFPNARYLRADVTDADGVEYVISDDGRISAQSEVFDLVLSTQVLEHVAAPLTYLSECFRVLKKGGRLLLSTHGMYEDHGCPYDFQRWTADGLKRDLTQAILM